MPGLSFTNQTDFNNQSTGLWSGGSTGNNDPWTGAGEDYRSMEDKQRDLLSGEWSRYKDVYRPLEDYLFEQLGNWGPITEKAQQTAMGDANRQFALGRQSSDRQMRGYGVSLNTDQRKSMDRQYDMAAATSAIGAANQTGQQMDDMRTQLVGGFQSYQPQLGAPK